MQRVCSVPQRGLSYLDIKGSLVVLYIYRKDVIWQADCSKIQLRYFIIYKCCNNVNSIIQFNTNITFNANSIIQLNTNITINANSIIQLNTNITFNANSINQFNADSIQISHSMPIHHNFVQLLHSMKI